MANKDNRLGAPTEGLGQNVTFQTATGRSSQQQTVGRRGPNVGMEGGGGARLTSRPIEIPDVVSEGARTMKALQAIGGEILKPHIERQRDEAYLRGMQRAATGEAIKEIVDEQPWYSKVFGDTPMVEGARAWTGMERTQAAMQGIEADMPALRKLSPERVRDLLAQRAQELGNSGDRDTDLIVTQNFMKAMPGFLKAHTKEHLGYQQETYARASMGAQQAAGARLLGSLSRPTSGQLDDTQDMDTLMAGAAVYQGPGERMEAKIDFIQAFAQAPGLPLETHQKITTSSILNMVSGGNLHAFNVLDEAGVLRDLGADNEKRIRDYADRAENKLKATMPVNMVNQLSDIRTISQRGDTVEDLAALQRKVRDFNANWAQMTGAREPFIKGETAAQYQSSLMTGIIDTQRKAFEAAQRASEKASGSAEKAAELQQEATLVAQAVLGGNSLVGFGDKAVQGAWDQLRQDPKLLTTARYLQANVGKFDEAGRTQIVGRATVALVTDNADAWEKLYQDDFLPLVNQNLEGNTSTAMAYLDRSGTVGPDLIGVMGKYHMLRQSGATTANSQLAAFIQAKNDPVLRAKPTEAVTTIMKVIEDDTNKWYGFAQLDERFHRQLAERLAPSVIGGTEADAETALKIARGKGLQIAGGFFWYDSPGLSFMADAVKAANVEGIKFTAETVQPKMAEFMEKRAKSVGIDPDGMSFTGGVRNGKPVIHIVGSLKDGQLYLDTVQADELGVFALAESKVPTIPMTSIPALVAGPKNTMGPIENPEPGSYTARRKAKNDALR